MDRKLAGLVLAGLLSACTTYQVTPVARASDIAQSSQIDVLHSNPSRPYEVVGMVSAKKYKPGWSDPTVSDAIPELRAAGAEVGADAVIVRSSRSNGDRHIRIEAEAIRYTGEAPPSPAIARMVSAQTAAGPAPRGDRAERDCAAIQIESIRRDCENRMRAITGNLDCDRDGPMYVQTRRVDKINDTASCTVMADTSHRIKGGLLGMVIGGRLSFSVMGDNFPGEKQAIRVDGNPAYVFDEFVTGESAIRLLAELKSGSSVTTRFNEWPQHVNRDNTHKVCNFAQLVEDCLASAR